MNKLIITIDGFAATGKSTQAKRLAKALNYNYVDTGAMYRAVTLFALEQPPEGNLDFDLLNRSLDQIQIHFEEGAEEQQTFLNGINVSQAIRDPKINQHVSKVAAQKEVRSFLSNTQKLLGANKGVVMDGRDIGTAVFPQAECKFFLSATPEVRAMRRYQEQVQAGVDESYEAVLASVKARDEQDTTRAYAPLKKAEDALEIEVSNLTIEEVFDLLYAHVSKQLN